MLKFTPNADVTHDYDLPEKPFGLKDDGLLYRFTHTTNNSFKDGDEGFIANALVIVIILSILASGFSILYLLYHVFFGSFAISHTTPLIISAIPAIIGSTYAHWFDTIGGPYTKQRNRLIKYLKQPLISTDHDTVRHLYDFIDFERSTNQQLVFHNDTDQTFVLITRSHTDKNLLNAVDHYSKTECLSDTDIMDRVRSIQVISQHKNIEIQSQYQQQFHRNTTTPIDTPYYRSLEHSRQNIDAEIQTLTHEHDKNIKDNAEIIERM